jgi:cytochrome c peroxidase
MRKLSLILLLSLSPYSFSSDTDQILSDFIKLFNFKAIKTPTGYDQDVYNLGKELFFENNVSGNKNISCSTCHHPDLFSGDALPLPIGEGGEGLGTNRVSSRGNQTIPRNSPALFNLTHKEMKSLFWDGRVSYRRDWDTYQTPSELLNGDYPERYDITEALGGALAAQALFPPLSHAEMRGEKGSNEIANAKNEEDAWAIIMKRLFSEKKYVSLFKKAFKDVKKFNIGHFGNALAHFQEHEFSSVDTPWDDYLNGNLNALSESEKRGALVFMTTAQCTKCHNGDLLGGNNFKSIASPQTGPGKDIRKNDEGRFLITKKDSDLYMFRVPPLRNVSVTGPFFHSGAYDTLEKVVDHYIDGARTIDNYNSSWLDLFNSNYNSRLFVERDRYMNFKKKNAAHPLVRSGVITLTREERSDLIKFLKFSLTDYKYRSFVK